MSANVVLVQKNLKMKEAKMANADNTNNKLRVRVYAFCFATQTTVSANMTTNVM